MTREEAYIWNENSHDENYSTVKEMEESIHYLLKRIYDSFENRSCKNCKFGMIDMFDDDIECVKIEAETQGTYFTSDFCCNKWESK